MKKILATLTLLCATNAFSRPLLPTIEGPVANLLYDMLESQIEEGTIEVTQVNFESPYTFLKGINLEIEMQIENRGMQVLDLGIFEIQKIEEYVKLGTKKIP